MSNTPAPAAEAAQHDHLVHFYEDEKALISSVTLFLEGALAVGGSAIVLATKAHRELMSLRLAERFPKPRLHLLDAAEALSRISSDRGVDEQLFRQVMGDLLDSAGPGPIRIYGELVALLAADGRHLEAIALEQCWNDLAALREFKLFCGYPLEVFSGAQHSEAFRKVCHAHTDVLPVGGVDVSASELAMLQQKALSLDVESARRRDAEKRLEDHQLEFAEFVENGAESLHQVAFDGTVIWANRAELELLGYGFDEYVGRNITEFHVDPPVIEDILKRLTAGETLRNYEARLRCKDGGVKHVLIQSSGRFEDGKLLYTRCFSRDVTERVALEQVKRERNDLLREAPVATALLIGPEHRFELANDLYKAMVGRPDLEGKTYLEAFPELRGTEVLGALDHAFATGEPYVAREYRMLLDRTGTGGLEEHFFRFNLQPIRQSTGQVHGLMAVAVDVSDLVVARRQAELAKVEREALLEELETAANAKDEFLAMLGHELRNPLAPIVTALELMKRRGDLKTSKEQSIIYRQVRHLIRLVDDLMDVSRITRGKVGLHEETVELESVLTKAVEMVNLLMEQRGHTLHTDIPSSGLRWRGDPVRLAQVVSNLLTNAARYTPLDGQIQLTAQRDGETAVITVADNGQGIAPDVLPRIFDLFYQGARTVHRAEGGLGVGLALVKSLVAAHGGSVHAHSDGLGLGSTFTVRLQLAPAFFPEVLAPANPDSTLSHGPSLKILVVDDNEDAANLLAEALRDSGHEVRVAYEPAGALVIAFAFKPEVALLDIGLPVMDGYELAAQLRKELGEASPKFYSLTGFGQPGDQERSAAAEFEGHFVKPVDTARVLTAVRGISARETFALFPSA
ncbi:ATP-binding protein [Variovorax sp. LT1R16]|uniref:ATP-binding protein n=1 Tax=Variovorax sp. LT1R16 TaxID=3443728 RepID=UPI003F4574B3